VVGLRIQNELKGNLCIPIKETSSNRKQICVSRSLSDPIDSLEELRQIIIKYVLIASAKLRKYNQLSSAITIFTNTNVHSKDFYKSEATGKINVPTSDSRIILKTSLDLTRKIFRPYKRLIKAGVILHKLQSNQYEQKQLFNQQSIEKELSQQRLNYVIDEINNRNGRDTINWGSSIIEKEWSPRREKVSLIKTTNIENIPTIYAN
jgi:DNA polymerase V